MFSQTDLELLVFTRHAGFTKKSRTFHEEFTYISTRPHTVAHHVVMCSVIRVRSRGESRERRRESHENQKFAFHDAFHKRGMVREIFVFT